jgi:hypothetical protein
MAEREKDLGAARRYYTVVHAIADHKSNQYREAKAFLKKNKK